MKALIEEIKHVFTPAFTDGFRCGGIDAREDGPPPLNPPPKRLLTRLLYRYAVNIWEAGYMAGYKCEKQWGLRRKPEQQGEQK